MPNWCSNTVQIKGDEIFTKLLKGLVDDESTIDDFFKHTINIDNSNGDWYHDNCRDIGCKWDVQAHVSFESDNSLVIFFESPWAPPMEGIKHLASRYNISLEFSYEESGELYMGRGSIDKDGCFIDEEWFGDDYLKGQYVINGIEHIYEDIDCYDSVDDFIENWAENLSVEDAKLLKKAINDELDVTVIQLLQLDQSKRLSL
tara:strand:- start:144 stop:749 length:606 start_codon:yes stop_codon:yes gene_type:complete